MKNYDSTDILNVPSVEVLKFQLLYVAKDKLKILLLIVT